MTDFPEERAGNVEMAWARILADIAHDVRGAAGGTDMWLELLGRARDAAERDRATDELRRALGRAVHIAEDLADAAALVNGAPAKPALPFDLATALDASRLRMEPEARARHVALAWAMAPGFSHPMSGDAEAWGRTLDRIVMAALALRETPVTVRVAGMPTGGVEIAVPCAGLELLADRPIFDAWGAARPPGRVFPLGLYLARAHLERAGGRLDTPDGADGRRLVALIP